MSEPPRPQRRVRNGWARLDQRLSRLEGTAWRRIRSVPLRWWVRAAAVTIVLLIASYLLGLGVGWMGWFRDLVDRAWVVYDHVLERVIPWAMLLPLAIAYVAYRVYRADQWWKRAEWALDAASEGRAHTRRRFGNKAIDELLVSRMAPTEDFTMFDAVVAERYADLVQEIALSDPTVSPPPRASRADPDVDGTQERRGQ